MVDQQAQRVEIAIEISPQDSRDIKKLLEEIKRAESGLFKIQQVNDEVQSGGGAAYDIRSPMSEASHTDSRKRKRFDPSDLTEGKSPTESTAEGGEEGLGSIGALGAGLLGGRSDATPKGKETPIKIPRNPGEPLGAPVERMKSKLITQQDFDEFKKGLTLGDVTGGMSTLSTLIRNPTGFIAGIIGEVVPIIAPILIAKGLMDFIIAELTKPGGVFERRFKIWIEKQIVKTLDRERLAQISAGLVEVRVSSAKTMRGSRGLVGTNLNLFKRGGTTLYDETLENYSKGGHQ